MFWKTLWFLTKNAITVGFEEIWCQENIFSRHRELSHPCST